VLDNLNLTREYGYMKKLIALVLTLVCMLSLVACGGNVKNVKTTDYSSEIYSDAEIKSAIDVAIEYFKKNFEGCTLTEITYLGDDKLDDWQEFAERNNADDVIVLVSTFEVDASGGDGSLNPNSTYTNWKWILVRTDGGKWKHVDHGY
jgi:ABC-type glycerol-3-phosphate transport system substrate-binding protein